MPVLQNRISGKDGQVVPRIAVHTSAYTISPRDNGSIFTNAGAAGSVTFTLPPALKGREYHFVNGNNAADTLVLSRAGSDVIRIVTQVVDAATATAAEEGESVTLTCVEDGVWTGRCVVGTWA